MSEENFYSLGRYFKKTFGERIHKIRVNVSGTLVEDEDGVILNACGPLAAAAGEEPSPTEQQIRESKERIRRRYKTGKFIVNLQSDAGSPVSLENMYGLVDELLRDGDIIGIIIPATPECMSDGFCRLLKHTSEYILTWLELGIQSVHDDTLRRIGAKHTHEMTRRAMKKLLGTQLFTAPRVVLGLPGETEEMMRATMKEVARMNIHGININHLCVLRGAYIEEQYKKGEFEPLSREQYGKLVCDFIEILPPEIVLHRIVGEAAEDQLVAPDWTLEKKENLANITEEMKKRSSTQGCRQLEPVPAITASPDE